VQRTTDNLAKTIKPITFAEAKIIVTPYVDKLDHSLAKDAASEREEDICTIAKILMLLTQLPSPLITDNINILSIGAGKPREYIAFRAYYHHILKKECAIQYVGVDINAELFTYMQITYQHYKNEVKLLTVDASNRKNLRQALRNNQVLPTAGFPLIFIRHPYVRANGKEAADMHNIFQEIVAYSASATATLITTCYVPEEKIIIKKYCGHHDLKLSLNLAGTYQLNREPIENDVFALIYQCEGTAFKKQFCNSVSFFPPLTPEKPLTKVEQKLQQNALQLDGSKNSMSYREAIAERNYNTALRRACLFGLLDQALLLLEKQDHLPGFKINDPATDGRTALDCAEQSANNAATKQVLIHTLALYGAAKGIRAKK
jgi:hypothetical protein